MKLDKLHIKNYRLFEDLQIDEFAQINLIAGKNNSGKTALLEAIRIWASEGDETVVNEILYKRREYEAKSNWAGYEAFFNQIGNKAKNILTINNQGLALSNKNKRTIYSNKGDMQKLNFELWETQCYPIIYKNQDLRNIIVADQVYYISSGTITDNLSLWEDVNLTPKKRHVLEALNLIKDGIVDIGVYEKSVKILLDGDEKPISINQLGEGVFRVFSIILALVSAQDSILLIDEFENGLHYSIQEKLWDFIFKLSKKLNVQVIATTHSSDCIKAFSDVLRKDKNQGLGQYMRLDRNKEGKVKAVVYENEILFNAVDSQIETR